MEKHEVSSLKKKKKNQGNYSKPKNKGNTEFSYLRENPKNEGFLHWVVQT